VGRDGADSGHRAGAGTPGSAGFSPAPGDDYQL